MLPLELPEVEDYSPRTFDPDDADTSPETPLSRNEDWVNVELDLGDGRGVQRYRRETNTMPNWAGSCWYELRYLDPHNDQRLVDPEAESYWMGPREGAPHGGVDLYVGGAEHAVLHLLYARFWSKVLFDLGHVSSAEPFHKLFNQGMIQAYVYRDARGIAVPAAEVEEHEGGVYYYEGGKVSRLLGKMGKSLKNAVTPDEICAEYGADTLRLYEMAMGPLDVSRPWDTRAVVGQYRLLQRLWRNVVDEATGELTVVDTEPDEATLRALHKAVDGVRQDMAGLRFNTAIAKITELNNQVTKLTEVPRSVAEGLVLLIAPLAPHIAEELWSKLGHQDSVVHRNFPVADPAYVVDETVTCVVQIKGKVKARLEVSPAIADEELEKLALAEPAVVAALGEAGIRKVIVRAPKLVNIVPA
jgi:leucyl-tRNA synthetase